MKKMLIAMCLSVSAVIGASAQAVEYTLQLSGNCEGEVYINIGEPTTGIDEIEPARRIYPNPVADLLYVPVHAPGKKVNVLLSDSSGKRLRQELVSGDEFFCRIEMSQYPSGIYFVVVIDTKETVYKVIKQ
jgi:hypothetical protein